MTRKRIASARLLSAQAEIVAAHAALDATLVPWRGFLRRHRTALIVGGGLGAGLLAGALPARSWKPAGSIISAGGAALLKALIVPMITANVFAPQAAMPAASQNDAGAAD